MTEKNIMDFFDTLIKIFEEKYQVKITYELKEV